MRTKRTKRTKQRTKRKSRNIRKHGGTYYSYNKNPLRFTSSTTQMGGKITLNTSDSLIPQVIKNMGRNFMYNSSSNSLSGSYPPVNPDPSVQPINKSFMQK